MADRKPYPSDVSDEEWASLSSLIWLSFDKTPLSATTTCARSSMRVDTLGHLLALFVSPANEQEPAWVGELAEVVQEAPGESVELAYVDLTLIRMQCPPIVSNTGNKKSLTYAGSTSLCNA
jgi:hypothetical protein